LIDSIVNTLIIVPSISNLQAEAECTVIDDRVEYSAFKGGDCSLLEVNGTLAGESNVYPQIDVKYDWKICNDNEGASEVTLKNPSYFKLWRYKPGKKAKKETLLETVFADTAALKKKAGAGAKCKTMSRNETLDTSFLTTFVSAQMQGPTTVKGDFCYAYAFNPISVRYGNCDMSVSTFATKYQLLHNDPF